MPLFQLQLNLQWRPDTPSLLVGLLVGILLTAAFYYWLPALRRWRDQAVGRVRQSVAWLRSGVEVRYQGETAEFLSRYHLGGQWGGLADIFTPPRLLALQSEVDPNALAEWQTSQLSLIWSDLAAKVALPPLPGADLLSLLVNGRRVLISAPPGGGKTTLLAYAAYQCATAQELPLLPLLPAYIHLAELDLTPFAPGDPDEQTKPADPLAPLIAALQRYTSPLTSPGLRDLFQSKMKVGQALLLLDGWDELAPGSRSLCLTWLHRLLELYPAGRLLMAVGLRGYGRLLDLDFARTQILPWRQREAEAFAAGWAAALNNNPLRPDRYWQPGQTPLQTSLRFWRAALAAQSDAAQKPRRDVDLLSQTLPLLWSPAGDKGDDAFVTAAHDFWQRTAYYLLREGQLILPKEAAMTLAAETAAAYEIKDLPARLQKSLEQCPLFLPVRGGGIRFRNLIWRDYLAAAHLAHQPDAHQPDAHQPDGHQADLEMVQAALDNPQWRGLLRFYVAQPEVPPATIMQLANSLLQATDRTPTRENLFQVAAWLPEVVEGKGEWQRQVLILLGQIIRQSTFPQLLRQRAVAALMQTGEQGVFTFTTQLLERSDPFLRQLGVIGLSHLGLLRPQEVIKRLVACLEDGTAAVRLAAVQGLAWLPHPLAERPLLTALIDGDDEMSRMAAEGIALRGAEGLEILREALQDESLHVRRAAIYGLLMANDKQIVPWLEKVEKEDKEWLVRSAATEALDTMRQKQKMAWNPPDLNKQRWLVNYAAHDGQMVPHGAAALPFLVQVLAEATDPAIRMAAAANISQMSAYEVLPALETAVHYDNKQVSEAAFSTLCTVRGAYDL
jgi:HEAT repeat protein